MTRLITRDFDEKWLKKYHRVPLKELSQDIELDRSVIEIDL